MVGGSWMTVSALRDPKGRRVALRAREADLHPTSVRNPASPASQMPRAPTRALSRSGADSASRRAQRGPHSTRAEPAPGGPRQLS